MTLKILPKTPFAPTFNDTKSPVAVVAEPGYQSKDAKPPVVKLVDVDDNANPYPLVKPLNVPAMPLLAAIDEF